MYARIDSFALVGLKATCVTIEVSIHNGLFAFGIVGLAGKSVQESRERVFSAIKNSGFEMPMKRIIVNLSPADVVKNTSGFDLPIATAILLATKQISRDMADSIVWGELSLAGKTLYTRGALAIADETKNNKKAKLLLPHINAIEASIVAGIKIYGIRELRDYKTESSLEEPIKTMSPRALISGNTDGEYDFSNIKGQFFVKRAIEIACAGGHNILIQGTPGSGKTYLSKCLVSILPDMSYEEMIEVTKIYSVSGLLDKAGLVTCRPFRSPHHTSSYVALIGGGTIPRPGEVTLSHRGVLFLDEFNEFESRALESLRQPIEDKHVNIARIGGVVNYPANFMLVAAMNPCKCGYSGDEEKPCTCSRNEIERFKHKISGPILDRIDMQIRTTKLKKEDLLQNKDEEKSLKVRERVMNARKIQANRFEGLGYKNVYTNADMSQKQLLHSLKIDAQAKSAMNRLLENPALSARTYFRLLKLSRTIADLEQDEVIQKRHIAEAVAYRFASE